MWLFINSSKLYKLCKTTTNFSTAVSSINELNGKNNFVKNYPLSWLEYLILFQKRGVTGVLGLGECAASFGCSSYYL